MDVASNILNIATRKDEARDVLLNQLWRWSASELGFMGFRSGDRCTKKVRLKTQLGINTLRRRGDNHNFLLRRCVRVCYVGLA
jgi:hypothetical protein